MGRAVGSCVKCGKTRTLAARKMCAPCYVRWRYLNGTPVKCSRCGELRLPFSKGMCKSCYSVLRLYPDASLFGSETHRARLSAAHSPNRREKSPRWRGGRFTDKEGYVRVLPPDGYQGKRTHSGRYVHEHRLLVEQATGRILADGEVAHHRDRDKTHNVIGNLALMPSVSAHRRLHAAEDKAGRELDPRLFGGITFTADGRQELPVAAGIAVE